VAQGYWNDPDRTLRAFRDPYTYQTGDYVEILEDGDNPKLRFIGRRDHLVKSRGYRIELGEVEAALYDHDGVSEAVVVAVPDPLLGNRLAAFCTTSGGTSEAEIRSACRDRVPAYMVPERIVLVEELPRTANDKYDRVELAQRAVALIGGGARDR
jgi:acyl-coenzyme A synthetase/AMP-(fatty) acid ligase